MTEIFCLELEILLVLDKSLLNLCLELWQLLLDEPLIKCTLGNNIFPLRTSLQILRGDHALDNCHMVSDEPSLLNLQKIEERQHELPIVQILLPRILRQLCDFVENFSEFVYWYKPLLQLGLQIYTLVFLFHFTHLFKAQKVFGLQHRTLIHGQLLELLHLDLGCGLFSPPFRLRPHLFPAHQPREVIIKTLFCLVNR